VTTEHPAQPPAAPPAAPEPEPDPAAEAAPGAAPRAPRRPRPVLLSACALALGTLAGVGVGYAVQAQRPPTPLPPLQVARPAYPARAVDPTAFAAEQPAPLSIEGDLPKLLITAPEGSGAWADFPNLPSWVSVGEVAERSAEAARLFRDLNDSGFRRAAEVDWMKDGVKYRVSLTQYAPDHAVEAKAHRAKPFADDANGGYVVMTEPETWADSTDQYYYGQASAQRGTVQMTVEIFSPRPVDSATLKDLAKKQWERLV
jgi:hypothetical protein